MAQGDEGTEGKEAAKSGWWQKPVAVIAGVTALLGAIGGLLQTFESPAIARLVDRLLGEPAEVATATPAPENVTATSALTATAPAAGADPHWIADPQAGCEVYNSWPQPNEAVTWSGPCVNGRAHGTGILIWFQDGSPTGLRYEGEYKNGMRDGPGVETMWEGSDEAVYTGEFKANNRHGRGTLVWVNRESWEGPFTYGLPNGWGRFTAADGTTSERQYVNGNFIAER